MNVNHFQMEDTKDFQSGDKATDRVGGRKSGGRKDRGMETEPQRRRERQRVNSLPCWPPSLLLLWGLEDMFNILLYSSSSLLIQPQPQVPAALWLLMARDERRGIENPLIMTSLPSVLHCCCCSSIFAQAMHHWHMWCDGISVVFMYLVLLLYEAIYNATQNIQSQKHRTFKQCP